MDIREIQGSAELKAVAQLQRDVWGVEDIDVLAPLSLRASLAAGALLLGAFDGPTMVGFSYAFPGRHNDFHSDMTGVLPQYRDHGIGYQLKIAQRRWALSHGVNTITWTFDPLQSRNAHFNFNKLGAVSNEYIVDFYGSESTSFLHQNSTDRLWIVWHLDRPRTVPTEITGDIVVSRTSTGPVRHTLRPGPKAIIEIPEVMPEEFARQWRTVTRAAFLELFDAGYTVTASIRGRYQLERLRTGHADAILNRVLA